MTMKRGELCELVCKVKGEGRNRIKYGRDYQAIIDYDREIETVKYYVLLKDFTEVFYLVYTISKGKNAFTMGIDEKIEHGNRKKELGVKFIKEGELKKAMKVFQNTNSLFELNVSNQELPRVLALKNQCLLNTSLILQK